MGSAAAVNTWTPPEISPATDEATPEVVADAAHVGAGENGAARKSSIKIIKRFLWTTPEQRKPFSDDITPAVTVEYTLIERRSPAGKFELYLIRTDGDLTCDPHNGMHFVHQQDQPYGPDDFAYGSNVAERMVAVRNYLSGLADEAVLPKPSNQGDARNFIASVVRTGIGWLLNAGANVESLGRAYTTLPVEAEAALDRALTWLIEATGIDPDATGNPEGPSNLLNTIDRQEYRDHNGLFKSWRARFDSEVNNLLDVQDTETVADDLGELAVFAAMMAVALKSRAGRRANRTGRPPRTGHGRIARAFHQAAHKLGTRDLSRRINNSSPEALSNMARRFPVTMNLMHGKLQTARPTPATLEALGKLENALQAENAFAPGLVALGGGDAPLDLPQPARSGPVPPPGNPDFTTTSQSRLAELHPHVSDKIVEFANRYGSLKPGVIEQLSIAFNGVPPEIAVRDLQQLLDSKSGPPIPSADIFRIKDMQDAQRALGDVAQGADRRLFYGEIAPNDLANEINAAQAAAQGSDGAAPVADLIPVEVTRNGSKFKGYVRGDLPAIRQRIANAGGDVRILRDLLPALGLTAGDANITPPAAPPASDTDVAALVDLVDLQNYTTEQRPYIKQALQQYFENNGIATPQDVFEFSQLASSPDHKVIMEQISGDAALLEVNESLAEIGSGPGDSGAVAYSPYKQADAAEAARAINQDAARTPGDRNGPFALPITIKTSFGDTPVVIVGRPSQIVQRIADLKDARIEIDSNASQLQQSAGLSFAQLIDILSGANAHTPGMEGRISYPGQASMTADEVTAYKSSIVSSIARQAGVSQAHHVYLQLAMEHYLDRQGARQPQQVYDALARLEDRQNGPAAELLQYAGKLQAAAYVEGAMSGVADMEFEILAEPLPSQVMARVIRLNSTAASQIQEHGPVDPTVADTVMIVTPFGEQQVIVKARHSQMPAVQDRLEQLTSKGRIGGLRISARTGTRDFDSRIESSLELVRVRRRNIPDQTVPANLRLPAAQGELPSWVDEGRFRLTDRPEVTAFRNARDRSTRYLVRGEFSRFNKVEQARIARGLIEGNPRTYGKYRDNIGELRQTLDVTGRQFFLVYDEQGQLGGIATLTPTTVVYDTSTAEDPETQIGEAQYLGQVVAVPNGPKGAGTEATQLALNHAAQSGQDVVYYTTAPENLLGLYSTRRLNPDVTAPELAGDQAAGEHFLVDDDGRVVLGRDGQPVEIPYEQGTQINIANTVDAQTNIVYFHNPTTGQTVGLQGYLPPEGLSGAEFARAAKILNQFDARTYPTTHEAARQLASADRVILLPSADREKAPGVAVLRHTAAGDYDVTVYTVPGASINETLVRNQLEAAAAALQELGEVDGPVRFTFVEP